MKRFLLFIFILSSLQGLTQILGRDGYYYIGNPYLNNQKDAIWSTSIPNKFGLMLKTDTLFKIQYGTYPNQTSKWVFRKNIIYVDTSSTSAPPVASVDSLYIKLGCVSLATSRWLFTGDTLYLDTCATVSPGGTVDSLFFSFGCASGLSKWYYSNDTVYLDTCFYSGDTSNHITDSYGIMDMDYNQTADETIEVDTSEVATSYDISLKQDLDDTTTYDFTKYDFSKIQRHGFVSADSVTLSFDEGTHILTLAPVNTQWQYFRAGFIYTITGSKTYDLDAIPTGFANGEFYYIYIDNSTGDLTASENPWTLLDNKVTVAFLYWNSTLFPKSLLADELHQSLIDRRIHYYLHTTRGTQWAYGGIPDDFVLNDASSDDNNTVSITDAILLDEDLIEDLDTLFDPTGAAGGGRYVAFYHSGVNTWTWDTTNMPYKHSGTYIQYDNGTGLSTGQQTKYYNSYIFLTNFHETEARFAIIMGQQEFASAAAAYAENPLTFDFTGFPINEAVAAWQLTWKSSNAYGTKGKVVLNRNPQRLGSTVTSITIPSATEIDPEFKEHVRDSVLNIIMWEMLGDTAALKNSYKVYFPDSIYLNRYAVPQLKVGEPVGLPLIMRKVGTAPMGQLAQTSWKDFGDSIFVAAPDLRIIPLPSVDSSATGDALYKIAGDTLVFGDLCVKNSTGKLIKCDADSNIWVPGEFVYIEKTTLMPDSTGLFLTSGYVRCDAKWNWTMGGQNGMIYDSNVEGTMSQTAPVGSLEWVQAVGTAETADIIYFKPDKLIFQLE